MQNELNVNVHTRALRAAERTNGDSGRLQGIKHGEPEPWWKHYFKWERLTVSGRTVEKGFVITPTIAAILLAAFLGVLGWGYKSSTADSRETRDAVIRMETLLNERTRSFEREQNKFDANLKDEIKLADMFRQDQKEKMTEIRLAMKQAGIKTN